MVQERDDWNDSMYLDFKKAFDCISHKILVWKLKYKLSIGRPLPRQLEDFLRHKKMITV